MQHTPKSLFDQTLQTLRKVIPSDIHTDIGYALLNQSYERNKYVKVVMTLNIVNVETVLNKKSTSYSEQWLHYCKYNLTSEALLSYLHHISFPERNRFLMWLKRKYHLPRSAIETKQVPSSAWLLVTSNDQVVCIMLTDPIVMDTCHGCYFVHCSTL